MFFGTLFSISLFLFQMFLKNRKGHPHFIRKSLRSLSVVNMLTSTMPHALRVQPRYTILSYSFPRSPSSCIFPFAPYAEWSFF